MDNYLYLGLEIADDFNNKCLHEESIEDVEIYENSTQDDSEYDEF